jgi:hypothetical protein
LESLRLHRCGSPDAGDAEVATNENNPPRGIPMTPRPHRSNPSRIRHLAGAFLLSLCLGGIALAAPISGAIFTSDVDGNVNINQYEAKEDVYLNGGPTNDNCDAAGVDDGVYVFQITNPSGTVLLSSDDIAFREFTVTGGVIVSSNNHPTVAGDCGGVRVQMAPFDDTPNNGGVYKAWITRKSDYIANGNTFRQSDTKTDNFMVKQPSQEPDTADLTVYKFYDANANGEWDADEMPLFGWAMTASNSNGFNSTQLTESPDGLTSWTGLSIADNPYQVLEGTAGGTWSQSVSIVNGLATGSPENPVTGLNLTADAVTTVIFGNYCKYKCGGKSKSWWLTDAGRTKVNDGGSMNPEFNALNQLNLRSSSGAHWNLNTTTVSQATNWTNLSNFLNGTSTTNQAYALSRNLAVLRLNIDAGYVNANDFYPSFGGTIAELRDDANAALGIDGFTPSGDANRALQAQLTTWVVNINNGATVIRAKPCPFSFEPY